MDFNLSQYANNLFPGSDSKRIYMCGIYGIARQDKKVDIDFLRTQSNLLTHRGPDDAGAWVNVNGNVGLAHQRLSILDLTDAGRQPMQSQCGRYIVVFNGEIYNFVALRELLKSEGYIFSNKTDTEVILNAYKSWGVNCVDQFNGMFSFVIYDCGDEFTAPSLFFARDRVGKKPFYYFFDHNTFEFASEVKAISNKTDISLSALNYYLALGYIPGSNCLFEGVKKLPPAHAGILCLKTFKLRTWQYWSVPKNNPIQDIHGEALADEVDEILTDSIKLRMMSDVPLGVLLSGGLDSSLVAAIASKHSEKPIKTFTLSLPGSKLDEASYAQTVSKHISSEHHVLEINKPSIRDLEFIAPLIDEPIADSSIIPSYLVSKLSREYVTVVLGGDGGDELFGGYSDYSSALNTDRYTKHIPNFMLNNLSHLASMLPVGMKGRNRLLSLRGGAFEQQVWGTPYFDYSYRKKLISPSFLSLISDIEEPENFLLKFFAQGIDAVDSMTRSHFGSILPDDFMVKVDRASMAVGMEARSPFLDYRLVEYAFSKIPSHWKVKQNETRRVQRLLAKRYLPRELDSKRKQGFSIPLDEWMRADNCELFRSYASYLPECICRNEVDNLIKGLRRGRANGARIYALLLLAISVKNSQS